VASLFKASSLTVFTSASAFSPQHWRHLFRSEHSGGNFRPSRRLGWRRGRLVKHHGVSLTSPQCLASCSCPLCRTFLLRSFFCSRVSLSRKWMCRLGNPTRWPWFAPDERSAAAGITGVARSIGAAISPTFAGVLLGNPVLLGAPFFVAGALKVVYDILLYRKLSRDQGTENHKEKKPLTLLEGAPSYGRNNELYILHGLSGSRKGLPLLCVSRRHRTL